MEVKVEVEMEVKVEMERKGKQQTQEPQSPVPSPVWTIAMPPYPHIPALLGPCKHSTRLCSHLMGTRLGWGKVLSQHSSLEDIYIYNIYLFFLYGKN